MFVLRHHLLLVAYSFPRATDREASRFQRAQLLLEGNCELRGAENAQGQISEHFFPPNGCYCVYYPSNIFSQDARFENWRTSITSIWRENMLAYLSPDINCSEKRKVFRERRELCMVWRDGFFCSFRTWLILVISLKPWSRPGYSCQNLSRFLQHEAAIHNIFTPFGGMLAHRRSLPRNLLGFPSNSLVPIYTPGWREVYPGLRDFS